MSEGQRCRVLVTVKTYPLLSSRYTETVCSAGLREDGSWVRMYPINYRYMSKAQRFRKYQWIEAEMIKDTRDPRPESHRLTSAIMPLDALGTSDGWEARRQRVLGGKIYTDLGELIGEARNTCISTSLATFKPTRILGFEMEKIPYGFDGKREMLMNTLSFCEAKRLAETIPYRFYFTFRDAAGRCSRQQILDWEIYQLCRKIIAKHGCDDATVLEHMKRKCFDDLPCRRDLYFFLGTTRHWHIRRSKNPFTIVGLFYPPRA